MPFVDAASDVVGAGLGLLAGIAILVGIGMLIDKLSD